MAKIILNNDYVAENADVKQTGKYLFDQENGTPITELFVWLEKSKANDKHPDGKPWIKLPANNITNRTYFSEDLFNDTAVDGVVEVEIKTTAPRVLGATGVRKDVIKFLNEEEVVEYTDLVETAVAAFKEARVSARKKKPEEMTKEELQAYIDALNNGTPITAAQGPKSFLDMFDEAGYTRYNELLAISAENKANAPKAPRRKLTDEERAARAEKRKANEISKAEALLAALQAK